jgi:choice-of-anchor C domain-containing protein
MRGLFRQNPKFWVSAVTIAAVAVGALAASSARGFADVTLSGVERSLSPDSYPRTRITVPHSVTNVTEAGAESYCIWQDVDGQIQPTGICGGGNHGAIIGATLRPGTYLVLVNFAHSHVGQVHIRLAPDTLQADLSLGAVDYAPSLNREDHGPVTRLETVHVVTNVRSTGAEGFCIWEQRGAGSMHTGICGGEGRDPIIGATLPPGFYFLGLTRTGEVAQVIVEMASTGAPQGAALTDPHCPDPSLNSDSIFYDAAQLAIPRLLDLSASGYWPLTDCILTEHRAGYINTGPNFTLNLDVPSDQRVSLSVESDCDSTLMVRAANGRWRFNDDRNGAMPGIDMSGIELDGPVQVWVGTKDRGSCDATLITQLVGHGSDGVATTGCPDPSQTGQVAQHTAAQLAYPQRHPVVVAGGAALAQCAFGPSGSTYLGPLADRIGGSGLAGFVREAPDYTFELTGMADLPLRLDTETPCDPVMLVRDAAGGWHFDDDSNRLQPMVILPAGRADGRVQVWVGGYDEHQNCRGMLALQVTGDGGGTAGDNLIINGSFEEAPRRYGLDSGIVGWTVTRENVDIVTTYWQQIDGAHSLDLAGTYGSGEIAQTVATVPGRSYTLSFAYAGNPACDAPLKEMTLGFGGQSRAITFDASGTTLRQMGWRDFSVTFTATGASTEISFTSTGPNRACGMALDRVELR